MSTPRRVESKETVSYYEIAAKKSNGWSQLHTQWLIEAFQRHGVTPPEAGDHDWLRKICILVNAIESKNALPQNPQGWGGK